MKHLTPLFKIMTLCVAALSVAFLAKAATGIPAKSSGPNTVSVVGISKSEGNKATEVIIAFGKKIRIAKGTKLTVKLRHYVKGNAMFRKIGEIKITEFIEDNQAKCEVTKNKEEIYSFFNESPDDIFAFPVVKSKSRY